MEEKILLKEIGSRINKARKSIQMTQEQLAEKMDVSVQMISNLELGKKAIRPENLVKACRALNVSADYILLGRSSHYDHIKTMEEYNKLTIEKQMLIDNIIQAML